MWKSWCCGQTPAVGRTLNIKITLMLKYILQKYPIVKKITFRFPIPENSFLPNDSKFGNEDCSLKTHKNLYQCDAELQKGKLVCCQKDELFSI